MISQRSHHGDQRQFTLSEMLCGNQLLFSYTSRFTFYGVVKYVQIIYLFKMSTFLTKLYFGTLKDLYIYEKQTAKLRNNPIL